MGFLRFLVKILIQGTFIFLLISLMPGLPPYVQFTEFKVTEPSSLAGALSVNTLLNNAEHLYSGKIHGPEAFEDFDGVLYTGIHGGEIVKFVDGRIVPVTKFGEHCDGFWDEKNCGRPLGMKFGADGYLYVADAYSGIFKVNVNSGSKIQLVSVDEAIEEKFSKLPNSIDVAADGTVYWSTSSNDFLLQDGVYAGFADGSGRLIRYDPRTKKNEVLIEGLHFANGVVLSPNEEFILVAESFRSRIHRYYLKGPKKGERDVFIDGLPGVPDNLKSDGQGGFFVPLIVVRDKSNPVLFQSFGPFPMLRKFVSRVFALLEMGFEQIEKVYPNGFTKKAIHWLGHFESVSALTPKGFILLQIDINGNIKHSYHNTDKSLSGISEVQWFNGALYFGSPYNTYVGRVKLSFAESEEKESFTSKQEPQIQKQASSQRSEKPSPPPQQAQKPSLSPQQAQKPSPSSQQAQKPSPPPQQAQKPSPPPQQAQKPSPPPQQAQKPSPPPQQAQKPSPPPQQAQKPSPPPQQAQKPSPPPQQAQKPSAPPQQAQKPSPSPQQAQKPSPPPQQAQKPSSPSQQAQKPSPPPQQAQKPSSPSQQAQKPSPPPQQAQKPSPPHVETHTPSPAYQQAQKPSPPPQQVHIPSPSHQEAHIPSPLPQQTQKPSPSPQQAQKPSPPLQQAQKPSPPPKQSAPLQQHQKSSSAQQQTSQPPQKSESSSQEQQYTPHSEQQKSQQQQESRSSGVKP